MAKFGELLSELRQDRGMTQKDLAELLFVTTGTISNYENGVHYPDVEKLVSLASIFGVTTDYLLGLCSANLSPDAFNEETLAGKTAGELIREIRDLNPERRQALAVFLRDMNLLAQIEKMWGDKYDSILYPGNGG